MSDAIHTDEDIEQANIFPKVVIKALPQLRIFHQKLRDEGLTRGIIGPRDADILWERHILNSAALVPFIYKAMRGKQFSTVADIGSGGGFPGLVLAACLPSCSFTLIEPMERRVQWLNECVEEMSLNNVVVVRARAEQAIEALRRAHGNTASRIKKNPNVVVDDEILEAITHPFTVVTCRAVAPLTKLVPWTLPLLQTHGKLIALKGRSAREEINKAKQVIRQYGGTHPFVTQAEVGEGFEPTHVVTITKI